MAVDTRHTPRTIDLDPDLLATPFARETNWHVITGAPSCGKTTLIDMLADQGFRTVAEAARQFIETEMSAGYSIDELHERGLLQLLGDGEPVAELGEQGLVGRADE